jgi:type II secretory pathway component GspD/PulD (secretin)
MRRSFVTAGLCGLLLISTFTASGQMVTEVIPLQHRVSEEIIPVLQPFLDKQGAVSGIQNQLIVRTTVINLEEIKRLLTEIDVAPRLLIIIVKQDVDRATEEHLRDALGSGSGAGGRITITGDDSGRVAGGGQKRSSRQSARTISSRSLESDRNTQRVQVLEGNRAFIRSGQSLPLPARGLIYSPQGDVRVVENAQMRDAVTGFSVLPRVYGKQVMLEISSQRDRSSVQNPSSIDIQQMATVVSGRMGEWIEIGGVGQGRAEKVNNSRSITTNGQQRKVWVKVEEAH